MSQSSDEAAVLAANAAFYAAFESLSIEDMDAVWAHEEPVLCVHPGWPLLSTREQVIESWRRIFENASLMRFDITGAQVVVEGDAAWVSCTENLTQVLDGRVAEAKIQATNLFRRRLGEWRVAHHHGSAIGQ